MRIWEPNIDRILKIAPICMTTALLLFGVVPFALAAPSQLANRYDKISSSVASSNAQHEIGFNITNLSVPVGSISIDFCSNSPLVDDPCTAPPGFDALTANLNSTQGENGFVINPALSSANRILLTRPAALPTGAFAKYFFSNIKNPDTPGSYYVRLQTFTSTDGTGAYIEYGGLVFAIVRQLSVTTEVPPYLVFCVGVTIVGTDCGSINSYFIDQGELSTTAPRVGSSEFAVATNAPSGYSVSISGATLTSGSHIIPALTSPTGSVPGTGQFGLNLRLNTNPSIGNEPVGYLAGTITVPYATQNKFQFVNGDALVTASGTSDYEKFTVSYITNVSNTQAAGIYTTTMTYIALANF